MSELEKVLKKVMYGGIGAAAVIIEAGAELGRTLVEKGQETMANHQETADDIKRRVKEFCDKFIPEDKMDVNRMSTQQRDELRRQLQELEEQDAAARAEAECDDTDDDEPIYEPEEPTYTAPDEE